MVASPPLCVSPLAACLIGIAERQQTGTLRIGNRQLHLASGSLVDVTASANDFDLGELLVRSGRLPEEQLRELRADAERLGESLPERLRGCGLGAGELRAQVRALWLERLTRALRLYALQPLEADAFCEQASVPSALPELRARVVPLLLDALSRIALHSDAVEVGARTEQRLVWADGAAASEAMHWAAFGEFPAAPRVRSILNKLPACAPQIAALVRAGVAELREMSPDEAAAVSNLPGPTLGPPASRLSNLPLLQASVPPRVSAVDLLRPEAADPSGARLRPGGAGNWVVEEIPKVSPTRWPKLQQLPLIDPLRDVENELQECSDEPKRSQLYTRLAELWEQRMGSVEEAARYFREAAQAAPNDPAMQLQAAYALARAGHGDLALRFTTATLTNNPSERLCAEARRLEAELLCKLGQPDAAEKVLEASALEQPQTSWPQQQLAALAYEQGDLPRAARHMSAIARQKRSDEPQRALALYALAYAWDPSHSAVAVEYADMLLSLQHAAAAVAVLRQSARSSDGMTDVVLLREAATRAQHHYRHSLAAELWAGVVRAEPTPTAAFDALLECLPRAGGPAQRVAVLEALLQPLAQHGTQANLRGALASICEALQQCDGTAALAAEYAAIAAGTLDADSLSAYAQRETQVLWERAQKPPHPDDATRLGALRALTGDWDGVARASMDVLRNAPQSALACARLYQAARIGIQDPRLRREALNLLTRTHEEPARVWLLLGEEHELMGDSGAALDCARSALQHDHQSADAALMALRHLQAVPPEHALRLLAQAERLLAGPPAVQFAIAQLAIGPEQAQTQRAALTRLIELLPDFVLPRLVLLEWGLQHGTAEEIEADARGMVLHAGVTPVGEQLQRAVQSLAERGEYACAARLAELWLETCARQEPELADHAYELAQASGQGILQVRALERIASARTDAERARCLFQLAMRHKAAGDRVAELRALLRATALPDSRPRALHQLGLRFAELGDLARFLMILSMRLSLATTPQERRSLLFEMACASVHFAGDHARALSYMRGYLQECHGERRALLFCLGGLFALGDSAWALRVGAELAHEQPPEVGAALLLWLAHRASASASTAAVALSLATEGAKHFVNSTELLLLAERLALELRDQASAEELYRALIADAWGMHGRRALHYRAGRWLETFGDTHAALAQYQHAFEISCSQGVVYAALTRCARALNQPERVFAALYQLIQQPESERRRAPLFAEAVGVCLHECGNPAQALALLFEAESSVPMGALDSLTIEVAAHLGNHDDEGAIMLHELMRTRAERIESIWDPDSKADALMSLAQLQETAGKDAAAAARTLEPLLSGPLSSELSANKAEQARAHHARITRDVA